MSKMYNLPLAIPPPPFPLTVVLHVLAPQKILPYLQKNLFLGLRIKFQFFITLITSTPKWQYYEQKVSTSEEINFFHSSSICGYLL